MTLARGPLGAVLFLAFQGVRRRALSSVLTALSVALAVALVTSVGLVRASAERSYATAAKGYHAILGPAGGSPLQTVLSTMFHVDVPYGTLPWAVYEQARTDPRVSAAVPYAIGDTFRGHRVVGTTPALFETLHGVDDRSLGADLQGRLFRDGALEAVVGSLVARATGLKPGTRFQITHGLAHGGHEHGEPWTVVGVMRPTGTPHDRAIYIPLETFYSIEGHGPPGGGAGATDRALSAVAVRLASPGLVLQYLAEFRSARGDAQVALPQEQVQKLMGIVGDVNRVFQFVGWLVTVVAAVGILVGLYNTLQGRRREIAVLRALGAHARHVFGVILAEALLLCLGGGIAGLLLGHGAVAVTAPLLLDAYGVVADVGPGAADLGLLLGVLLLGLLAGTVPAARGLATPVAENLHPSG